MPVGGCERGGDGRKIKWKLSEVNTRAAYRVQNELIGKFKMAAGYSITWPLILITSHTVILNLPINPFCSLDTGLVLNSDNFHLFFPPLPHLSLSQSLGGIFGTF